jgi:hypothetical protein
VDESDSSFPRGVISVHDFNILAGDDFNSFFDGGKKAGR